MNRKENFYHSPVLLSMVLLFSLVSTSISVMGVPLVYPGLVLLVLVFIFERFQTRTLLLFETKMYLFSSLWIMYALLQFIVAHDKSLYQLVLKSLVINIFLFCITIAICENQKAIRQVFFWCYIVSLVVLFIGLVEAFFTIRFLVPERELLEKWSFNVWGTQGNINDWATWLFLVFFFVFFHLYSSKSLAVHIIDMVALGLVVYLVLLTSSRGVLLAILFFFGIFNFGIITGKWIRSRDIHWLVLLFSIFLVGLLIVVYIYIRINVGSEVSNSLRKDYLKYGMEGLVKTYGFGVGPGQSIAYFNSNLHGFLLEIIVEYGIIIGLVIIYLTVVYPFRKFRIINVYSIDCWNRYISIVAFTSSWVVAGISSSSAFIKIKGIWIIFALIIELDHYNYQLNGDE